MTKIVFVVLALGVSSAALSEEKPEPQSAAAGAANEFRDRRDERAASG